MSIADKALDALMKPASDVLLKLLGPAAQETGQMLGDIVRVYRLGRSVKLLNKVKRLAEEAGFEPRAVPVRLLLPILEVASLEQDEDLHTMWANLLANAANPSTDPDLTGWPAFLEVLKQLSPYEARFLERLYGRALRYGRAIFQQEFYLGTDQDLAAYTGDPIEAHVSGGWMKLHLLLDNVERLGIVARRRRIARFESPTNPEPDYYLTAFGYRFLLACRQSSEVAPAGIRNAEEGSRG